MSKLTVGYQVQKEGAKGDQGWGPLCSERIARHFEKLGHAIRALMVEPEQSETESEAEHAPTELPAI